MSADLLIAAAAFAGGAIFGSFSNVVIFRLPRGESLVSPPSKCPDCGRRLRWYENVPLLSYLALRGRCSGCGRRISGRYFAVEALTGLVWGLTVVRLGATWVLPAYLVLGTVLVVIAFIDLEHRRIPHKVLLPAGAAGIVLLLAASAVEDRFRDLLFAGVGAVAFSLPFFILVLLMPGGMGAGDFKLSLYLGLHLGWLGLSRVLVAGFLSVILGGLVASVLLVSGRKGRKDPIPFGPFLCLGSLISLWFGAEITRLWLGPL